MDRKIKTSLYIRLGVWRSIKKAAIDAGQTVGEFVTSIFTKWRAERANNKPTNLSGRTKNRANGD